MLKSVALTSLSPTGMVTDLGFRSFSEGAASASASRPSTGRPCARTPRGVCRDPCARLPAPCFRKLRTLREGASEAPYCLLRALFEEPVPYSRELLLLLMPLLDSAGEACALALGAHAAAGCGSWRGSRSPRGTAIGCIVDPTTWAAACVSLP